MGLKLISFKIEGLKPSIQHNGRLKNPLNPYSKELAARVAVYKKNKTDENLISAFECEFKGSLYLADDEKGKTPIWPSHCIHAMLKTSAKEFKKGKATDVGLTVLEDAIIEYDGPKNSNGLWKDSRFRLVRDVKIPGRGSSNMRCRPIFNEWALNIRLRFNEKFFDEEMIIRIVENAGEYIGLSDWQRVYGLFSSVIIPSNGE